MSPRQRAVVVVAVVLTGLLLGGGGWALIGYVDHRSAIDQHLSTLVGENARISSILLDCTTPTPPATDADPEPAPHECYERGQRGQSGAIVEVDCRIRRMQARLPAPPNSRRPCTEQTPAEVYPGVAGQPPR